MTTESPASPVDPRPSRRLRWPWLRRIACVLAVVVVATAAWPLWLHVTGNFHVVVPGRVYRSAQPSADELRHWTATYGLRSVLNLRGTHTDAGWYRNESATADALGLRLVDFPLSARRNPGPQDMARLVALLDSLPKPLLIHCQGGADRTGLAAALYLGAVAGAGEASAERQLSFAFGHVGVPYLSSAWAMDEAWEDAERWLGYPGT